MLIAIDTGGTKTLITGFSRSGKPTNSYRFPTPKDKENYIAHVSETIHDNFKNVTYDAIVIGVPGVVKDNKVEWSGNLGWKDFDIVAAIRTTFDCPVWLENDANLAGLAETMALPTIPRSCLYVTISTGIGTGIIIDGQIAPAFQQSEGGRSMLEYDGKIRSWESFASGRAIYSTYGKFAHDITSKSTWRQIADKISRGFLTIIPLLQPDVIIIGGSIGSYYDRYHVILKKLLRERIQSEIPIPEIRQAIHPEEAVVYGCYYYGKDKLTRR